MIPPQTIDVATGAAQPLGVWRGLTAVTATRGGQLVALIDGRHHVHLVGPGRKPEALPGQIDIAAFATDNQLVLTTLDGAIFVHDVEHHQRTPLGPHRAGLLGLAWGHGRHPWVAAAFADGTLWRKNLATGVEAEISRVPRPDHLSAPDGKLIAGDDGAVLFLHDREVRAWRPDGTIARLAVAPKPLDDFAEQGARQIIAIARDTAVFAIRLDAPEQVTPLLPTIDGTSAAMSPDTGLLAVIAHGQLDIVDPLGHQQWTLGQARGVTFRTPAISADGRHVLADTGHSLVLWSLERPATPEATAAWLDAMTNAIDDGSARGLGWR